MIFIKKINNTPIYAERAKETTTGRDIDTFLNGIPVDSTTNVPAEMSTTEVSDLLGALQS